MLASSCVEPGRSLTLAEMLQTSRKRGREPSGPAGFLHGGSAFFALPSRVNGRDSEAAKRYREQEQEVCSAPAFDDDVDPLCPATRLAAFASTADLLAHCEARPEYRGVEAPSALESYLMSRMRVESHERSAEMMEEEMEDYRRLCFHAFAVRFPLDAARFHQTVGAVAAGSRLQALFLHAREHEDGLCFPSISIDFTASQIFLPSLRVLSVKNQAVRHVRLSHAAVPALSWVSLSDAPEGSAVEVFEVSLPQSLERLELEFMTILDGAGLVCSLDSATNPKLRSVKRLHCRVHMSEAR